MSKCSKKCNEIKSKIDSISGLDDDFIFHKLTQLEKITEKIVNEIDCYSNLDELNGTCFK